MTTVERSAPSDLDVERLQAIVDGIVDRAEQGEQLEAYAARGRTTSVEVYERDIESLTQAETAGVGIRVIRDGRTGFAWAATLDDDAVAEAISEARDNRSFTEPDEFAGLAEPDGHAPRQIDTFRADISETSTDDKVAMALELERITLARDPRIGSVESAGYRDSAGAFAIATSTGIRAADWSTSAVVSVHTVAEDEAGTVTGYGFSVGHAVADLSLDEAATDAVERTVAKLGAAKPESATVTLILEPRLTATLIGIISGMLGGTAVANGRSPFADRLGEQIASPLLSLVDDPTNPASFGAEAFDDEGLATRPVTLLDDGVLQGFLHNTYSGRKMSTASTASAVRGFSSLPGVGSRAMAIQPGSGDLDSLVAEVDDGVLASSLGGIHSGVNPISGDFSVSVEGLRVRDGARAEPIKEATLASTLQRLLLDISHVGADVEWQPSGTGGVTLLIPGVTLSGR